MSPLDNLSILLVEDNPRDAELTLRAFRKHNLANSVSVAHDGVEALDILFDPDRRRAAPESSCSISSCPSSMGSRCCGA
jgi:hypothetical protein